MHDSPIEDRLRTALRAEGDALPLTITPNELERRLALRRRERSGRRMSLIAAGVAVIAIGSVLAATGGWFSGATVGASPDASAPVDPSAPIVSPGTGSPDAGLPCQAIDPAALSEPPSLLIGTTPGDAVAYGGLRSSYRLDDRQVGDEGTWDHDSIGIESVPAGYPVERLQVLASNPDACLTGLLVDAVPTEAPNAPAMPLADLSIAPTRVIEFDKPPAGDWLMRVHADFATSTGSTAWAEAFFSVVVPDCTPLDPSSMSVPPAIGAGVVDGDAIGHDGVEVASAWNGQTTGTPGAWGELPAEPDWIRVDPDSQALQFVADACLVDVRVEALLTLYAAVPDPAPTPIELEVRRGHGSRVVEVAPPPPGGWTVRVRTTFLTVDGSEAWSETVFSVASQFDAPGLTAGPGFFEIVAEGRCPSYQLATGASAADSCGAPYLPIEDVEPLPVASGASMTFRLDDGWLIKEARIVAVDATLVAAGVFAPEYSLGLLEDVGRTLSVPIELDPGSWILRISLNGERGGDTFGAYYDLALVVGETEASFIPTVHGNDPITLLFDPEDGDCLESAGVFQIGPDLAMADEIIDEADAGEGWIDVPLGTSGVGRSFHGGVESAATAFGGLRLAVGGSSPWILLADGSARELRMATTISGRSIWWIGSSTKRVSCRAG